MTPGIQPSNVKIMLRKKLAIRPVMSTASGGKTTQKKYRSAFTSLTPPLSLRLRLLRLSVERFLRLPVARLLQLVIFDHRIRQQIAAKTMQTRFKIYILPLNIDLHVFTDPYGPHLWHSQVPHRIPNCAALGDEHGFLWHHNHFCLHTSPYLRGGTRQAQSVRDCADL